MLYPKGVVFYNPVQVQNRDLSLLMIQLYAERNYKSKIMGLKRKELRNEQLQQLNGGNTGDEEKKKKKRKNNNQVDVKEIELKLKEFEESVDWNQICNVNWSAGTSTSADATSTGAKSTGATSTGAT